MTRIAVFASGKGSNFRALAEAGKAGLFPGDIVLLISDQPGAGALEIAREFGIETLVIEPVKRRGRLDEASESLYLAACRERDVDWICLAGFMRILGDTMLGGYVDRVLNIHPSLLPSFPGLDAQTQAWEHGVGVSGCTVHLVDRGVDTGPIIMQRAVIREPDDSAADLAARILTQEHQLYAAALTRLLGGAWHREGRRILFGDSATTSNTRHSEDDRS
jgi:phosphoribosylglycinamide formyltransferase 1